MAGERLTVQSLVPRGGDPHSFAPGPRDVAMVADADLVFSIGLTLEAAWFDKLVKNAASDPSRRVALGDFITPIPFAGEVRHAAKDEGVLFLGLNLDKVPRGVFVNDEVALRLTEFSGPGHFMAYSTDSFGDPVVSLNTVDGLSPADRLALHSGSHTHINWIFTSPGKYTVGIQANAVLAAGGAPVAGPVARYTFQVGGEAAKSLSSGHVDLRVRYADGVWAHSIFDEAYAGDYEPGGIVLFVKQQAAQQVPKDPRFSFLGSPGSTIWVLPQGQEASHQHGPNDPHFWFDPREVKRVLPAIAERLAAVDPAGKAVYLDNAALYGQQLDELHTWIAREVAVIPQERRLIVTSHEALGYLAKAYGFRLVGSVIPGVTTTREPSPAELAKLVADIRQYQVPAIFGETILDARLTQRIAEEADVKVVTGLHTDSLGHRGSSAETYLDLMRATVKMLVDALK